MYYGNRVAAPVFKEIADKLYANQLHFAQSTTADTSDPARYLPYMKPGHVNDVRYLLDEFDVSVEEWAADEPDSLIQHRWMAPIPASIDTLGPIDERKIVPGLVPNVYGMGLQDALFLLENSGLKVEIEGKGRGKVRRQSIQPGKRVDEGQKIHIELS
jgi:cell division protein FtsI (penicillin-binding protein 3)